MTILQKKFLEVDFLQKTGKLYKLEVCGAPARPDPDGTSKGDVVYKQHPVKQTLPIHDTSPACMAASVCEYLLT